MKKKHWKILSLVMFIMTIGFSIAAVMGYSDATPTIMVCIGAALATYGASK